jgi:predicted Zn-dependent protease
MIHRTSRLRAGTTIAALLLALAPVSSSSARASRSRTSVASAGAVARPLSPRTVERERARADVRRRLAERERGTYISEMLAERDSALARWPDRRGKPLTIWIQWASTLRDWTGDYRNGVRDAVLEWDDVGLPVRFAFASDSARADVHVTFIDHFDEPISGRTKWARDDDWWITDAEIVLAVHHHSGPALDDDAMHAMALHELGHLLGLDHTEDPTSVMAPKVRVRALSAADLATVRLLYTLPPGGVR